MGESVGGRGADGITGGDERRKALASRSAASARGRKQAPAPLRWASDRETARHKPLCPTSPIFPADPPAVALPHPHPTQLTR